MAPLTQQISPETPAHASRLIPRLMERGFTAEYAPTPEAALEAALARIPEGAEVMTASSTTLDQIGAPAALEKGPYRFLKASVWSENDPAKRMRLRRAATAADWVLGSVPAITEDGTLVAVDASGSRVGSYAFGAGHVILVVSANKIVPSVEAAMDRVRNEVFQREDARMKGIGLPGSAYGKWLIYEREVNPGRTHVILVGGPPLGF